jgi:RNA polymerase sigma factor (sigma-70 family)
VAIEKAGAVLRPLRTLFHLGAVRELTDGHLLERFATDRGEVAELAFAVLVERHGAMVLRVCQGVLGDPDDAQDAYQATFLVLIRKARTLWVRDSLGPWLHQVAYRTASHARSAAARRRRHERRAATSRPEGRADGVDDLGRVLHEEIDRLPECYRAPVVLCDLEGRNHEQAARHLGWPVGTVKSRQARGRQRLRDRLRRRGLAPSAGLLMLAPRPGGPGPWLPLALVDSTTGAVIRSASAPAVVRGSALLLAQEILRAMSMTRWSRAAAAVLIAGATAAGVGLLARSETAGPQARPEGAVQAPRAYDGPVHEVRPGKLMINVVERGSLESSQNQDIYCQVEGQTTIIRIVPEGTRVKKGEIVCELDSASLRDRLVNQRITTQRAEAAYQNARLAREAAEIAVIEYAEGIFKQDLGTVRGEIASAQAAIQKAQSRLERTRRARQRMNEAQAARGGAAAPADIVAELEIEDRIEAAELALERENSALELAKTKQAVLQQYTRGKTIKALKVALEGSRADELAKQATWDLEKSKEAKLEKQIAACTLTAPVDGLIVYANDPVRTFGSNQPQIEEGATVRERQKIISMPDITKMQVNTKIHEAQIDKIVQNLKARIRVDAFADLVLSGRVLEVHPLPDPMNSFSADVKVYTAKVAIANPLAGLRPGMTAEVQIFDDRDGVLSVPVRAVLRYDGRDRVAVKRPDGGFDFREVILGLSDGQVIEVKEGIPSGAVVALNPLALMSEEEKRANLEAPTGPAAPARARGKGGRGASNPLLQKFQKMSPEDRARMKSASPKERAEILKKAGFTDEELRRLGLPGGADGGRSRRPNAEPPGGSRP